MISLTKSLTALLTLILVMATSFAYPQAQTPQVETPQAETPPTNAQQAAETAGAPVIFAGETLFSVYARIGAFSPAERASAISERMQRLSKDPLARIDSITVADSQTSTDILAGDIIIMTVTDEDVKVAGLTRLQVAQDYAQKISAALKKRVVSTSLKSILLGILFTLLATAVLIFIFKVLNNVFPRMYAQLNSWRGTRIPSLRIQRLEILPADRITDILIGLVKVVRVALVLALLYFYLPLVFSFFPWTSGLAATLFGYILTPLSAVWQAFVSYLDNLFFTAVIVVVTRYLIKFIRLIFTGVEKGAMNIPGFHREWADPTFKIGHVSNFLKNELTLFRNASYVMRRGKLTSDVDSFAHSPIRRFAHSQIRMTLSKCKQFYEICPSLDDFYVSYELNAHTDKPGIMAKIYSELHQNIQDKFNEADIEIMSPHYSAVRDGNQITIPADYLPETYTPPPFRILPLEGLFGKPGGKVPSKGEDT